MIKKGNLNRNNNSIYYMMNEYTSFQILIDQAGYKQYPLGGLSGKYMVHIDNISLLNTGAQQYTVSMKSNILQYETGSPTNDILFTHRDGANEIVNPICIEAQLQTWIDFQITDIATGSSPAGFTSILLTGRAFKL